MMPTLHSPGVMTPGQLGPTRRILLLGRIALDRHHVADRDPLGDADRQFDAGVGRLEDGVGGVGRRDEDHRDVGLGVAHRLLDGVEHRDPVDVDAPLAGGDAGDDLGAVLRHCWAWNRPLRPVIPWTSTFEFLLSRMDMSNLSVMNSLRVGARFPRPGRGNPAPTSAQHLHDALARRRRGCRRPGR